MAFTRLDVQTRLNNFFNNPTYYTTQNMNDAIQDGVDEIVAFCGTIVKSAEIDYIGGKTWYDMISLLPDYIGAIAIYSKPIKKWLLPTSVRELDQERIDWETCAGAPWFFTVVSHRYMGIFRKSLSDGYGKMILYYVASSPIIDDGSSIFIPDDHIQVVQDYGITDLLEQAQEFSKAASYYQQYTDGLNKLRLYVKNRRNPARIPYLK